MGLPGKLFVGPGEFRDVGRDPRVVGWDYTLVQSDSYCISPGPNNSLLHLLTADQAIDLSYSSPSLSHILI